MFRLRQKNGFLIKKRVPDLNVQSHPPLIFILAYTRSHHSYVHEVCTETKLSIKIGHVLWFEIRNFGVTNTQNNAFH